MKNWISKHPTLFAGVVAVVLIAAGAFAVTAGLNATATAQENTPRNVQEATVLLESKNPSEEKAQGYAQYASFDWANGNPLQLPGLTGEEQARAQALLERYETGVRPQAPAPSDPKGTGFAVVPLSPEDFGGLTQYVFLPRRALSDEELMQLIDYYAQMGGSFDPKSLDESNCMRGGCIETNRARTAEEDERLKSLEERYKRDGLRPRSAEEGVASGVLTVTLNETSHAGLTSFTLYPLRSLTDEELLELIDRNMAQSLYNREGFSPNWEVDEAKCRLIANTLFGMEDSASLTYDGYDAGDAILPDTYTARFESVQADGGRRWYSISIESSTNLFYSGSTAPVGSGIAPAPSGSPSGSPAGSAPSRPEPDLNDAKWADAARAFAREHYLADNEIESVRAYGTCSYNAGPAVNVAIGLNEGASLVLGLLEDTMEICSVTYYKDGFDVDAFLKSLG